MALAKPKLISDLSAAFASPLWATAAQLFAVAVNDYILSATATVTVNGIVTPPPPATPYPATGVGTGTPITTALPALTSACTAAFAAPSWGALSSLISPQIVNLIITATLVTTVTGVLNGAGALVSWVATGESALQTALNVAFTTGQSWVQVGTDIGNAIDAFLKTVTFSTTDAGVIPPASWVGTGAGGILS